MAGGFDIVVVRVEGYLGCLCGDYAGFATADGLIIKEDLDLAIEVIVARISFLCLADQYTDLPKSRVIQLTRVPVRERLYMPSLIVLLRCGAPRAGCDIFTLFGCTSISLKKRSPRFYRL